jgi:hypothetical protein
MYRLGKQIHKHRRIQRIAIVLLLVVLFAALVYWLMHLRIAPTATIRNDTPVSKNYTSSQAAKVTINKPEFKMEIPGGWTERKVETSPTGPRYTFAAPTGEPKMLDIYIDNPPTNLAINKAIVISLQGNGLTHDYVSENCVTFTDPKYKNPQTGFAPARWQEIDFICDMANSSRQVVGTISHDGMNQLSTTGVSGATHKVFMTYTDNDITPSYSTFYDILGSVQFK